jgi:excisionase family DNA binding protein
MQSVSLPTLFTPEEIAVNVKVNRRTIYHWLASGKLNGMRVGSSWRITEADLLAFMTQGGSGASAFSQPDRRFGRPGE